MDAKPIGNRLSTFARDVRLFAATVMPRPLGRDVAQQLARAASGAAANHRAARRGRSYAEFRAKLHVALEEIDEAQYWLQHVRDCRLAADDLVLPILREAGELVAILTVACKTTRAREGTKPTARSASSNLKVERRK